MNKQEFIQYVVDNYSYSVDLIRVLDSIYECVNGDKVVTGGALKRLLFAQLLEGIDLSEDEIINELWRDE